MIHRMDPPEPGEPLPEALAPMLGDAGADAERPGPLGRSRSTGRASARSRSATPGTWSCSDADGDGPAPAFPELFAIALELGGVPVALDGVITVLDDDGAPVGGAARAARSAPRPQSEIRRRRTQTPATLIIFDLLHEARESLLELPYTERRERLEALELEGESWRTPAYHRGDGDALREAARIQGLAGVVGKRLGLGLPARRADPRLARDPAGLDVAERLVQEGLVDADGERRPRARGRRAATIARVRAGIAW